MNNHVLIPTNLNDSTETLTKNAKIVFVYGLLCQCDSWGILPLNTNLTSYKIGLEENEVAEAIKELDKVGLIVRFNKNTLIAIQDFVLWNHFQFLKTNKKKCQYEKEVKTAIKEGKLYEGWLELPTISLKGKDKYLKQVNQVQVQEEVQADSKHNNTKKGVSTSTCTSTSSSDSDSISSSDSDSLLDKAYKKEREVIDEKDLPF